MGLTPASTAAWKNSIVPCMVPWSVSATAGISISLARLTSFLMLLKPSRSEYWE